MSLQIRRSGCEPGLLETYEPMGEGNFACVQVVTVGAKSIRVNRQLSSSLQKSKDGTLRGMLKTANPLSLASLTGVGDVSKPGNPAPYSAHTVITVDGRIAALKDNPEYSGLLAEVERRMLLDHICSLLGIHAGVQGGPSGSESTGEWVSNTITRLMNGTRAFIDGEVLGDSTVDPEV